MSIVTKQGDDGRTSLYYGKRVRKDSARIELCGLLDELNSFLGLGKSLLSNRTMRNTINSVQKELMIICTEIATDKSGLKKLRKRINKENIRALESLIGKLEKNKPERCGFIIPGKSPASAACDIARSVARTAERRIVSLARKGGVKNRRILIYFNRLSDLLYLIARSCE